MSRETLKRVGNQVSGNKSTILETPWLSGEDGAVTLGVDGSTDNLPASGVVEATTVRIGESATHTLGDMLAVFATERITIEPGATINGHGQCTAGNSVYGENGVYNSENWVHYAYQRILADNVMSLNIEFEHSICGGGQDVDGNNGGSALLLAAPVVDIQTPVSIDLTGAGNADDGHFGVLYSDKFIYDDAVNTNAKQVKYLPNEDTPREIT